MGGGPMDDISDSWVHVATEPESPSMQESIDSAEYPESEEPLSSDSSVSQPPFALPSSQDVGVTGEESADEILSGDSFERGNYSNDVIRSPDAIHSLKLKLQPRTTAAPKWQHILSAIQQGWLNMALPPRLRKWRYGLLWVALGLLVVIAAAAAARSTWPFQSGKIHHSSTIIPSPLNEDINPADAPSFKSDLKDSAQRATNSIFRTAGWRTPPMRNSDGTMHTIIDAFDLTDQVEPPTKESSALAKTPEKKERRSPLSPNREVAVYKQGQENMQMDSVALDSSKADNEVHVLYTATRHGIERVNSWLNLSGPALGLSATLGAVGLVVGVPYMPGLTDNIAVALVGAAVPLLSGHKLQERFVEQAATTGKNLSTLFREQCAIWAPTARDVQRNAAKFIRISANEFVLHLGSI